MVNKKEYALYKGDDLLGFGTIKEISSSLNILPETIKYYGTKAYKKKLIKRNDNNARELIALD